MYIRAGGLFQIKKPIVDPAKTTDMDAMRIWPSNTAIKNNAIELIATAPEAPPSMLSKKFIELVMPTIHKIVSKKSKKATRVGEPSVSVDMRTLVANTAIKFCEINLGHGLS
jgi:hypothetical protein